MNITKPSLQRIARQAGIKSMSDDCVDIIRTLLHAKTSEICDILILDSSSASYISYQYEAGQPQTYFQILFWYLYSDQQTANLIAVFDAYNFDFGQHLVNKLQFISLGLSGFLLRYFYSA